MRGWGGFGARGELGVALSRAVSLLLVAAADWTPPSWAGEIRFENVADALFPPARVRLFAGLGLGFLLFSLSLGFLNTSRQKSSPEGL